LDKAELQQKLSEKLQQLNMI
ncbi:TPA: PTS lactose transporter subunit IIB, partial [Staphylococcus aureus MRSA-Lux-16]|nr:PTS lactose transporter subunit IIB [Staphylococcus aureus MRSA-Lux-16]